MKTRLMVLAGLMIFTASALSGASPVLPGKLAVQKFLQERGPATKEGSNKKAKSTLPAQVQWNLKALAASFTIVSTTYDTKNWQVSWVLEARRTVTNPEYHAVFRDADLCSGRRRLLRSRRLARSTNPERVSKRSCHSRYPKPCKKSPRSRCIRASNGSGRPHGAGSSNSECLEERHQIAYFVFRQP